MLKISDILKKGKRQEKTAEQSAGTQGKGPLPADLPKESAETVVPAAKNVRQEPAVMAPKPPAQTQWHVLPDPAARETYERAIALVRQVLDPATESAAVFPLLQQIIDRIIDSLQQDEDQLMRLFFGDYFTEQGYLYQHSVNVSVLCVRLGQALHYGQKGIRQLALAALLHDIGMVRLNTIIGQQRRLNEAEYNAVKDHPVAAKECLKPYAQDLDLNIFEVIRQEHERVNGSGYPDSLQGQDIGDHAKVIGLVDVYEALLHPRPYRNKMNCLEAVKELLAMKSAFEYAFIKRLIDITGVFPVGTLVRLNTREVGIVTHQNDGMPLRPVVEITHNTQGQTFAERKFLDLAANFSVYIHDCFDESTLKR